MAEARKGVITLVLEGTYPYVRGGVSSWVAQVLRGFPDLQFQVIFLGSRREDYGERAYPLLKNIVFYREQFLFETRHHRGRPPKKLKADELEALRELHEVFRELRHKRQGDPPRLPDFLFETPERVERAQLCEVETWRWLCEEFLLKCNDPSFSDYFWTVRNLHLPLWPILEALSGIPPSDLIFSPSTGYAGFFAALLAQRQRTPFLLMEHGLYVVERMIDFYSARWVSDNRDPWLRSELELGHLRRVWMNFFQTLALIAYRQADCILSLFPGAREVQVKLGAPQERCQVLPNGVDIERLKKTRSERSFPPPKRVALIGRVTRIKDILTFIRAMKMVTDRDPNVEGWIVGPLDEEPDYVRQCQQAIAALGLAEKVKLLGFKRLDEIFPEIGLLVLTSISEGMPLVILEGFAAGVPAVATDVGSCRLLIEGGLDEEDRQLGSAGRVVPVMSPEKTAQAILELLEDYRLWQEAQHVAVERVERYYDQKKMYKRLRNIFRELIGQKEEHEILKMGTSRRASPVLNG